MADYTIVANGINSVVNSGGSQTLSVGTWTPQVGDVVLIFVAIKENGATIVPPTGFVNIMGYTPTPPATVEIAYGVFYKIWQTGDASSYTITFTGTGANDVSIAKLLVLRPPAGVTNSTVGGVAQSAIALGNLGYQSLLSAGSFSSGDIVGIYGAMSAAETNGDFSAYLFNSGGNAPTGELSDLDNAPTVSTTTGGDISHTYTISRFTSSVQPQTSTRYYEFLLDSLNLTSDLFYTAFYVKQPPSGTSYTHTGSGGAISGGAANVIGVGTSFSHTGSGGVISGGIATYLTNFYTVSGSGGVISGGVSSSLYFSGAFNTYYHTSSGGSISGGVASYIKNISSDIFNNVFEKNGFKVGGISNSKLSYLTLTTSGGTKLSGVSNSFLTNVIPREVYGFNNNWSISAIKSKIITGNFIKCYIGSGVEYKLKNITIRRDTTQTTINATLAGVYTNLNGLGMSIHQIQTTPNSSTNKILIPLAYIQSSWSSDDITDITATTTADFRYLSWEIDEIMYRSSTNTRIPPNWDIRPLDSVNGITIYSVSTTISPFSMFTEVSNG